MRFKSLLAVLLTSVLLFSSFSSYALTVILKNDSQTNIEYFWLPDGSPTGLWTEPVNHFRGRMLPNNLSERLVGRTGDVMFVADNTLFNCGEVKFHHALTAIVVRKDMTCAITSR